MTLGGLKVKRREVPSGLQLETGVDSGLGEEGVRWKDTVGTRYKSERPYLLTEWPGSLWKCFCVRQHCQIIDRAWIVRSQTPHRTACPWAGMLSTAARDTVLPNCRPTAWRWSCRHFVATKGHITVLRTDRLALEPVQSNSQTSNNTYLPYRISEHHFHASTSTPFELHAQPIFFCDIQ